MKYYLRIEKSSSAGNGNTKDALCSHGEEWRDWLMKHYESEAGVWLIYYKKHTGRPRIPYDHAVEEALCFGLVDSIVKRIDDKKYAQKFTPRRDYTKWSPMNIRRLRKLKREGRMTGAWLAKVDPMILGKEAQAKQNKRGMAIPQNVRQALMETRRHGRTSRTSGRPIAGPSL